MQISEVAACERYVADCLDNCTQFSSNELATRTGNCASKLYLRHRSRSGTDVPVVGLFRSWNVHRRSCETQRRTQRLYDGPAGHRYVVRMSDISGSYRSFRLVVTTFELARDDIEQLCDQYWSCIIVDEVHRVKNPKSRTSKTLNMFQCPVRLGLTGAAPGLFR